MKKALLLAGLLLIVLALLMLPPSSTPLSAQSGCCKMRDDPSRGEWRKALDKTFEQCRKVNEQLDGDDLFAESGRVWWDRQCS